VVLVVVSAGVREAVPGVADPVWLRDRIAAYGPLAPLAFVAVLAGQVVLAPVPGQALVFVGGLLFGPWKGALYGLTGATIGSAVAFVLARRVGRTYVERAFAPGLVTTFDALVESNGRFALFLAFLVPGLPDDAICFVAGVSRIPLPTLVAISVVGRLPGYLVLSYAGARFAAADYVTTSAILLAMAGLATLVYWRREDVLAALTRRSDGN
jgi:uncharacterized membrane protein YdjX (TVP38/TMEM64 family)